MSSDLLVVSGVLLNSPAPPMGTAGFIGVHAMMGVWITGAPSLEPQVPDVIIHGGDDAYEERPRKRRRLTLEEQPTKHLNYVIDKVAAEYYGELIAKDMPQSVRKAAAEAVRPFVKAKVKQVPAIRKVDWKALEEDRAAVERIMILWTKYIELQSILDDDDDFFMLLH